MRFSRPRVDPELAPHVREIETIQKQAETEPEVAEERMEKLIAKSPDKVQRWYNLGFDAAASSPDAA